MVSVRRWYFFESDSSGIESTRIKFDAFSLFGSEIRATFSRWRRSFKRAGARAGCLRDGIRYIFSDFDLVPHNTARTVAPRATPATKFPPARSLGRITRATYRVTKTYIAGKRLDFPDRRLAPEGEGSGERDRFYIYACASVPGVRRQSK